MVSPGPILAPHHHVDYVYYLYQRKFTKLHITKTLVLMSNTLWCIISKEWFFNCIALEKTLMCGPPQRTESKAQGVGPCILYIEKFPQMMATHREIPHFTVCGKRPELINFRCFITYKHKRH